MSHSRVRERASAAIARDGSAVCCPRVSRDADIAIVGAGAAGLTAAMFAARERSCRVLVLDGAVRLGAKILIAGGGRCNVTHDVVEETAYAGSSRPAIRKVLRRFGVEATIAWFADLGVDLVVEPGGKLFPSTGRARTVLDALLGGVRDAGAVLRHPCRVERVVPIADGFRIESDRGLLEVPRVVLATGGRSVPMTGSDGHGYAIARALGHTIDPEPFPALVPLTLPDGHPWIALSGVACPARVEVRAASGAEIASFEGPVLCTHFGLSGPAVLDASRYWVEARRRDPGASVVVCWWPGMTAEQLDRDLRALGHSTPLRLLRTSLPERLARTLCEQAGVDPAAPGDQLDRERRRALVRAVLAHMAPCTGTRGFRYAEVTAGGVPLREFDLATLESRVRPGLHLCGEILDVDGRIGGYNFQWAWASGYVAGLGSAHGGRKLADSRRPSA